jgi:hypothetical protein
MPNYSGVVLNQNQQPVGSILADGLWRYQEFFLPPGYTRGSSSSELIIPPLTGFQLLLGITDAETASVNWTLEYDLFGAGWQTLAEGTATGAHAEGDKVWLDLYFDSPFPITTDLIDQRFRLGFSSLSGVSKAWITTPNPFAAQFAKAYQANGTTVIQSSGADAAFDFRLLGRVADDGTDFLGNRYRSVVIEADGDDRTWLSKPNPSRFAVESLYYDVRPQTHDTYEKGTSAINYITNPKAANNVSGWSIQAAGGSPGGETLTNLDTDEYVSWPSGFCSGFVGYPNLDNNVRYHFTAGISVVAGDVVRFAGWVNSAGSLGQIDLSIARPAFASVVSDAQATPVGSQWYWLEVEYTAVATETLMIYVHHTTLASIQFTGMILTKNAAEIDLTQPTGYFDGDIGLSEWTGIRNASTSTYGPAWNVLNSGPADNAVVIDSVLVDPTTPGVYFNVYYSSDGQPGATADEWDDRLWTHVPSTFHALKRETHVLPEPIVAKYVKIEFSHLQARYYSPGDFARPIQYRKHPKWVLDYFLARTTAELAADRLFTGRVGVIYDAISLAYDYYLDDLAREPDQPVEIDQKYTSVQNFLSQRTDASDQVDSETLNKINLALAPYRNHPTSFSKDDYLLGQYATAAAGKQLASYPTEAQPSTIDFPDVAELRNEAVVFESDFPVMFFYLTCRHKYREVVAEFSHDRAYFAGVKEIAFTRDRYTAATDDTSYREPAGDLLNTERNDFTQIDGVMVIQ